MSGEERAGGGGPVYGPPVFWRRIAFAGLVLVTMEALIVLAVSALRAGGFGVADAILLALFVLTLPWIVIGFWNAAIGFFVMRFSADAVGYVTPVANAITGNEPILSRTAILLCIRNETPERLIRNLQPLLRGLGSAAPTQFHVYVLSDTDDASIAALEHTAFTALAAGAPLPVTYRRRTDNTGYKAGNIRDFCLTHGAQHDFALVLDADSVMSAASILRLVRMMQADPKLGILQSLVVGLPSTSGFARIFQFGMRLGMRSYTTGSAWWQAECGPYWGHNAVIRLAPFIAHCNVPDLPAGFLGGPVLSHDQIEAVLMRRAGYDVRVLSREDQSWEENPPTLIEFARRDLRWCQGNMQYVHLLTMPGLHPVSRFQLLFAVLMFTGSPGWIGMLTLGALFVAFSADPSALLNPAPALAIFWTTLFMWFSPKIASIAELLSRREARQAFGGTPRFLAGVATETLFFTLLMPIMWLEHTIFFVRLAMGKSGGWAAQMRDDHAVSWRDAFTRFWPQTLLGLMTLGTLAAKAPYAFPYAFFIGGGLALSVPLTVVTSSPRFGALLARLGIGRLPEETSVPASLQDLALPALANAPRPRAA